MTNFKNFKGAAKRIDDIDLPRLGHRIGVGEDEIHAFIDAETSGSGFDKQGRPKILFEPHRFYKELSGAQRTRAVKEGLAYPKWGEKPYPADSYPRLKKAMAINETAALKATSWGLGQVLGSNYELAGFKSVQEMVLAMMDDEDTHLEASVNFIKNSGLADDLKNHRWAAFARGYNGPGYAKNKYHTKLEAAYKKWAKIPDTPWSPSDELKKNLYDGKSYPEVLSVQEKLDSLGYAEVGAFDGRWGSRTRGAVLSFRADNNLPLDPVIDETLMTALMVAEPRKEAKERQQATVEDLRKEEVPEIKQNDQTKLGGGALVGVGSIYGASEVLEKFDSHSETLTKIMATIDPLKSFIQDNFWLLLIGGGAFFIWKSGILTRIRLEKHQTGKDVSE